MNNLNARRPITQVLCACRTAAVACVKKHWTNSCFRSLFFIINLLLLLLLLLLSVLVVIKLLVIKLLI